MNNNFMKFMCVCMHMCESRAHVKVYESETCGLFKPLFFIFYHTIFHLFSLVVNKGHHSENLASHQPELYNQLVGRFNNARINI